MKNARRYVEKSLRTKEQALAEEHADDLYIEISNDMKLGKSFLAINIKEGVALNLEHIKKDVDVGVVEGRYLFLRIEQINTLLVCLMCFLILNIPTKIIPHVFVVYFFL